MSLDVIQANTSDIQGLDCDTQSETVILISGDNQQFTVKKSDLKHSKVLSTSFENNDNSNNEINLKDIDSDILKLIIEYLEHHTEDTIKEIPYPLPTKNLEEVVSIWDSNFIENVSKSRTNLYKLITGANYLSIDGLLNLGCAKVASMVKGEPIEKLKDILVDK